MADINKIKGMIFDADGTLLDSMPMWGIVEEEYLKSLGVTPRPDLHDAIRALGGHEIAKYFQEEYAVRKTAEEMSAGIYKLMGEYYSDRVLLKSGAAGVLEELRARGIKMCVATATDKRLMEPALRQCGILGYFGKVFTCGEENTSKSSPDIYIRAASFLGTDINDTLVIEDALYAMRSAKRAGFPVAAVYDSAADTQQQEIKEACDFYFKTLDEMLDELRIEN